MSADSARNGGGHIDCLPPLGICRMLVEQVINGVMLENMYALTAQGYTLVFGLLDS